MPDSSKKRNKTVDGDPSTGDRGKQDTKSSRRSIDQSGEHTGRDKDHEGGEEEVTIKYPGVYITQLNENDVLQGRGSGSNQHPGNVKYRKMIETIASCVCINTKSKGKE